MVQRKPQALAQHVAIGSPGRRVAQPAALGVEGMDQRREIHPGLAMSRNDRAKALFDTFVPLHQRAVEIEGDRPRHAVNGPIFAVAKAGRAWMAAHHSATRGCRAAVISSGAISSSMRLMKGTAPMSASE